MFLLLFLTISVSIGSTLGVGPLDKDINNFKYLWNNDSTFEDYVNFGKKSLYQWTVESQRWDSSYDTYYTTTLRSDFKQNQSNTEYIMETKVNNTNSYHLFIRNGKLSWVFGNSTFSTQYDCSGFDISEIRSTWVLLVVKFEMYRFINCNYRYSRTAYCDPLIPIRMKKLDSNTPLNESLTEIKCVASRNNSFSFDTKDLTVRLGKGFTGEMAYGSVFRVYSMSDSRVDNVMKYKLPNEFEKDFSTVFLRWGNDTIPYRNSKIRKDMENEITTKYYTNITCTPSSVVISINPEPYNISSPYYRSYTRYTSYPMNITLGRIKKKCNFTYTNTDRYYNRYGVFKITANLDDCGFKSFIEPNKDLTYVNKILVSSRTFTKHLMDVSCTYEHMPTVYKDVHIEAFSVTRKRAQLNGVAARPDLGFSINIFSDREFSTQLKHPLKVVNKEYLFVQTSVDAKYDPATIYTGFELKIQSCLTKVVLNAVSSATHKLIENGVIVDETVKFLPSGDLSKKRFKFRAMKFDQFPDAVIYLNCVMSVADNREVKPSMVEE